MAFTTVVSYTTPSCMLCKAATVLELTAQEATDLQSGVYLQNALPLRDEDFRELVLTGTHAHCWDAMFPEED